MAVEEEAYAFPMSFAQKRLWFLDQLEPGSPIYNIPANVRLSGPLDIGVLEQCVNEIIRRHEILRTTFTMMDGEPVQVIAPALTLKPSVVDLQKIPEDKKTDEARRFAVKEFQRPFNLAEGPLLRVTLLRMAQSEYVLLMTMHHIIADAWSMPIFIRELSTLYRAFSSWEPSPLPELLIQYADFASWQHEWLQGKLLETQLAYWKKQLTSAPQAMDLPTNRTHPAKRSHAAGSIDFKINHELTRKLNDLSRQSGGTLFMTLLAAFAVLLSRYNGQEDIVVGSPIANRNRAEIEPLIGFFVNTLVLRLDLSGDPSFRELLRRVRQVALDAYDHQDVPFEKLVEALQPERSLNMNPLFQVLFVLQNAPTGELEMSGLNLSPLAEFETGMAKFDLEFSLWETGQGIDGKFIYKKDLFEAATIARMAGHFQTLVSGVVTHSELRISELPLLTEAERQRILIEWNDRNQEIEPRNSICPCSAPLHELFEKQALRTPEATAVVFEDQLLTYRELNNRANQLGHYLKTLGVGPEVLVGIYVERSLEMMVGLLGILKAGGAYLPLDPAHPLDRLAFMLADSGVSLVIGHSSWLQTLRQTMNDKGQTKIEYIDLNSEAISREGKANPISGAKGENLAYVIYTSGSTGEPKGVLVTHNNVTRLFTATQPWFHFNADDVWTLFHSYTFDFSVWEIWGALLHGGRLVVVPYWASRSPDAFHKLLCKEHVTVLNQTPSAFLQFMLADEVYGATQKLDLRLVIFGGESLEIQSLKPWFERHGDIRPLLVNMYGITETTVHVTYRPLTTADLNGPGSFIGRPIPDLRIYILDRHLQPSPIGIPGEIYVGGAGLARGYLNRPVLTREKFIPDPFSSCSDDRLYKTGDLARYLPNGDIQYCGRIDQQVQIRGFRVEPGEIESILARHPAVRETVVMAQGRDGDSRLTAYIVPDAGQAPDISGLRHFLREKLPDYMIPSAFVMLDSLPLTPNGKLDRKALPLPDMSRDILKEAYVAPRTSTEKAVAAIWLEVLKLERVGIHDNFFELGGHSLMATQVASRIRQAFQVEIPLRDLFEKPTIAELAERVVAEQLEGAEKEALENILAEVEGLSDEEAKRLLRAESH